MKKLSVVAAAIALAGCGANTRVPEWDGWCKN